MPNATLNISTDNFTTVNNTTTLSVRTDNDGSFTAQVPDMISKTVKIRVADADEPPAYAETENFTIAGKFNVTAPIDGNRFNISQNTNVTWTTVGTIPKVNITVYNTLPTNDSNWTRFPYTPENPLVIVTNYTNNGKFPWNVNDAATAYARLRISDYNYPEVCANSSGNFSIIGSFNITSPGEADLYRVERAIILPGLRQEVPLLKPR